MCQNRERAQTLKDRKASIDWSGVCNERCIAALGDTAGGAQRQRRKKKVNTLVGSDGTPTSAQG